MKYVDCVFVGSEAVLENGGIVNRIGTYTIALCAKAYNKPFYVCAESFKFLKRFILD
jgi:translation initiation factor eIF-2B subunit alpha